MKGDGTKLKPVVVIPGKKVPESLKKINSVFVECSANGWMNDSLTEVWLEKVYGNLSFSKRLLVWDSYKCHISEKMKST